MAGHLRNRVLTRNLAPSESFDESFGRFEDAVVGNGIDDEHFEERVIAAFTDAVAAVAPATDAFRAREAAFLALAAEAASVARQGLRRVPTQSAPTVVDPGVLGGDGGTPRAVVPTAAPANPPNAAMADAPPAATEATPDAMTDESVEEADEMDDTEDQIAAGDQTPRAPAPDATTQNAPQAAADGVRRVELALQSRSDGTVTPVPDLDVVELGRLGLLSNSVTNEFVSRCQAKLCRSPDGALCVVSTGANPTAVVSSTGAIILLTAGVGININIGDTIVLRPARLLREHGGEADGDEAFTLVEISTLAVALRDNSRLREEIAAALERADEATAREGAATSRATEAVAAEARADERAAEAEARFDAEKARADELRARLEAAEKALADAEEARDAAEQNVAAMLANPVPRDGVDTARHASRSSGRRAASAASAREAKKKTPTKGPRGKRQAKGQNV